MRFLSLFSGIEAATVAWVQELGWECVAVAEIEPFPCALLQHYYPDVPNLGDVTKITEDDIKALGPIDLVIFGSPCQDLSLAGLRQGFSDGTRSSLFFTAIRLIQWTRQHSGCRFALWENVYGAFSSNQGRDFAAVVSEMAGLSDVTPPKNGWGTEGCAVGDYGLLEWSVLDAQWFGVAQRRRRVFALADFGNWADRPPILLEPDSLRGDTAPSRETGQTTTYSVAPCLTSRGRGTERLGDTRGQDPVVADGSHWDSQEYPHPTLNQSHNTGGVGLSNQELFSQRGAYLVQTPAPPVAARLVAFGEYVDDGTASTIKQRDYKDATDLIAYGIPGNWIGRKPENGGNAVEPMHDVSPCLTSADRHGVAAYSVALRGREGGSTAELGDEVAGCLRASTGGGDKPHVLAPIAFDSRQDPVSSTQVFGALGASSPQAVAFVQNSRDEVRLMNGDGCITGTLAAQPGMKQQTYIQAEMAVRRLTPIECERLMGFPDNFTRIPWNKKPPENCPNGPRYKALGNSIATTVLTWIGKKIEAALTYERQS